MKQDIRKKTTVSNITGCLLFLQVFYLHSIDLGEISMAHDVFPRIKVFTADKIRAMINADKPMDSMRNRDFIFGISTPTDAAGSAYSGADDGFIAQQQGDAWACASKICDSLSLSHQVDDRCLAPYMTFCISRGTMQGGRINFLSLSMNE
ncbi:hypothetical protein VPH35_092186 [Triticum aestivum]|uniref:uncharacterized protein n=1 Tax=Triticum aestivum TaxID=4565 RepID=UPI001D008E5B|nr:uncharacterized protein LOC123113121 [Triticum aestivum]